MQIAKWRSHFENPFASKKLNLSILREKQKGIYLNIAFYIYCYMIKKKKGKF